MTEQEAWAIIVGVVMTFLAIIVGAWFQIIPEQLALFGIASVWTIIAAYLYGAKM